MPDSPTAATRAAAIADLFTALEGLVFAYQFLPDAERSARTAADADRITGEVSRLLSATRARLSPSYDPAR